MNGHTKGEWRIEKREGHSDGVRPVITTMDVDRIAIVSYRGVPSIKEADANALLIAAAPELLEACEKLVAAYTDDGLRTAGRLARQAIAKATKS